MRFCFFPLLLLTSVPALVHAQAEAPARHQLYGGYTYLSNSFNGLPGARQPLNGWDASIGFAPWHSIRFKIDVYGYSGTNLNAPQHGLFTLAGGQSSHTIRRVTIFGEGLMGTVGLNDDWGPQRTPTEGVGFAALLGGGLDTSLNRHFDYRVDGGFQYAYTSLKSPVFPYPPYRVPGLPTYFGRISTGLVWKF